MKILVERKWKKENYTIGIMYVDGKQFCNTLEDKDRGLTSSMSLAEIKSKKVYGQTAIPTGTYKVIMSYSQKFKKYLPEIPDVKGYAGIRIHSGNTAADSLGCILLGKNTQKGMVTNSRAYCSTFNSMLNDAISRGEEVTIEIK
jgi:hypothetical protein